MTIIAMPTGEEVLTVGRRQWCRWVPGSGWIPIVGELSLAQLKAGRLVAVYHEEETVY